MSTTSQAPGPQPALSRPQTYLRVYTREAEVKSTAKSNPVVVAITGTCPYGIGACWGGAYEALQRLEDVNTVNPIPNTTDSTAEVFLKDERLPALDQWYKQFCGIVNGTYEMRGVEVTLEGALERRGRTLFLTVRNHSSSVQLESMHAEDKVQWDHTKRERRPLTQEEALAYDKLAAAKPDLSGQTVLITGPIKQVGKVYILQVRLYK